MCIFMVRQWTIWCSSGLKSVDFQDRRIEFTFLCSCGDPMCHLTWNTIYTRSLNACSKVTRILQATRFSSSFATLSDFYSTEKQWELTAGERHSCCVTHSCVSIEEDMLQISLCVCGSQNQAFSSTSLANGSQWCCLWRRESWSRGSSACSRLASRCLFNAFCGM